MMKRIHEELYSSYGPRALIFGASEGIGLAFATELADAGFDLLLVARRIELLECAASDLTERFDVNVKTLSIDLSKTGCWEMTMKALKNEDFGLVIYNAAASPIGPFLDLDLQSLERTVSVNISSPLEIVHGAGNDLRQRYKTRQRRGGIILMSSLSGLRGTPHISAYAASKAWGMVLAEGISQENKHSGLDVLACIAGATDTPGYRDSVVENKTGAPIQSSLSVAREALASIGRKDYVITGRLNRIIAGLLYRTLPRKWGSFILGRATSGLRRREDAGLSFSE